jgi:plastocyanin
MISAMRRPGRKAIAACAGALLALGTAGVAWGAPATIVAPDSIDYSQPLYTQSQGDRSVFRNNDNGMAHNVISNGRIGGGRLFRSATITGSLAGTQAPVSGTQYLRQGDYTFFCSIHPNMEATLRVTGAGDPVPRPAFRLAIITRRLEKAQNTGRVRVKIRGITKSENVTLHLRFGKRQLATKRNVDVAPGQVRRPFMQLTRAGMARIAGREQAKLKLVGTVAFGKTRAVKKLLK